nr:daptide-type RiPP biosynthesis dehydogenase [Microbacterium hydrocarbonoxydans]
MTARFTGRVPTLWHGQGITSQMVTRLISGRVALVIADSSISSSLPVRASTRVIEMDARTTNVETVVRTAREVVHRKPDVIVAVGGGTVLDASKLSALALARERVFDFVVERSSRSALTFIPDVPLPVDLVAVPTTLGTSSETNSVGILKNEVGFRLVVGRSLRPRHAIIDPCNLMTLSPSAVREGTMEALLRLAGASTSSRQSDRARHDAIALGRALLDAGSTDSPSASARLRVARLSAATQRTGALRGKDPYSARHWYIANEVAFVLGVRKMVATAAVIAAVWGRICSGDPRWGDRGSLERFWARIAEGMALPLDPSSGIATVIHRWGLTLPQRPTAGEADRITVAIERCWGDRLPMLPGLRADDFSELLRDSLWSSKRRHRTPTSDDLHRGGD